ncbi:hypothetical protein BX666DRAFT_1852815 [Dichotomocladium elegans]|nr:hypothetical protein BX666DRAFT_1852815 [Dichotomocladium elegans]
MPQYSKSMDGFGTTVSDNVDHILIESSSQVDGLHTEKDTLKLLEYMSVCLQEEKDRYQQASHTTFVKRRLFWIQVVGCKVTLLSTFASHDDRWACLWERSALIPSRWNQRKYWIQAFELITRLMDMLQEQDLVTEQLIDEHNGCVHVPKEDNLRSHYRKSI